MDVAQITTVIGAAASLLCTLVVGALTFFIKKTLATLEEADKRNAAQIAEAKKEAATQIAEAKREAAEKIAKVDEKLNDLKADLPLVYVTREDYIRVMNRVEDKLDQILYGKGKGKEEYGDRGCRCSTFQTRARLFRLSTVRSARLWRLAPCGQRGLLACLEGNGTGRKRLRRRPVPEVRHIRGV